MIGLRVSGFDWVTATGPNAKSTACRIAHIEAVFAHDPGIAPDPKHSAAEDRLIDEKESATA